MKVSAILHFDVFCVSLNHPASVTSSGYKVSLLIFMFADDG
uniref:Uncharacterized protein n=1 Tax=Arundo donax TaxID=35708 RepID=A0A0A9AFX3_ARUDO